MEAETGAMWLRANKCLEFPEATICNKGILPRAFEGTQPCQHLDFRLQPPGRGENMFILSLPVCGHVLLPPQETNTHLIDH